MNREELESSLLALVREVLITPGLHPVIYDCFSEYLATGVVNVRVVNEDDKGGQLDMHNGRGMRLRLQDAVSSIATGSLREGARCMGKLKDLLSSSLDYQKLCSNRYDTQDPRSTAY